MISARSLQCAFRTPGGTFPTTLRRFASGSSAPAQKLRETFEQYRQAHYSRETPTRFRKELVKSISSEGIVQKESLNQVLVNIGRKDRTLSDEEFSALSKEAGGLSTDEMMKLFS